MDDNDLLARRFEAERTRLRAVAYRMLGSVSEADDAVQEAWLRLNRSDTSGVENLSGWLTTVVGRVSLDMLRARRSRREDPLDAQAGGPRGVVDPEHEAVLADSVGLALLVVLEALSPAERLAFVLHDMFAVPFDEVAEIVGCSPAAARQLASRGRRRVHGSEPVPADRSRQREVVAAFLSASRNGEFDALLALLDPDVELRADDAAQRMGATGALGAAAVAQTFSGRAKGARLAFVDGSAGAVWSTGGKPRVVFAFTIVDELIIGIEMVSDPQRLDELDLEILDAELRPVGRVESPLVDRAQAPKQGDEGAPEAWLVLEPDVREAARDLRVGTEVIVLTWLDRASRDVLVVHPRGDLTAPERGVFSTRSPDRPNPIGLHTVRIVAVEGLRIRVQNLEALDGTPVLDLKPVLEPRGER